LITKKFAAIDIGSNAVRLLFMSALEKDGRTQFKKNELVRVALRLGEDAFLNKKISPKRIERLVHAMKAFYHLMQVNEVISYRACATSAMREAENAKEVVAIVEKETGIKIEIIDGGLEAEVIYSTHIEENLNGKGDYIYVDVGGGSTELTLFSNKNLIASQSFNIGTLRILNEQVKKSDWEQVKIWLKQNIDVKKDLAIIGSGGNINKLHKMTRKKETKPLTYDELRKLVKSISDLSVEERIMQLSLNPDRADVIVPAGTIYINIMKWAKINLVYVPKIGLSDGIVRSLYNEHKML
jgi:exopolyphosphatase/guanosine-5'-triphosphate,3'-diphosphate pyrophosphatase